MSNGSSTCWRGVEYKEDLEVVEGKVVVVLDGVVLIRDDEDEKRLYKWARSSDPLDDVFEEEVPETRRSGILFWNLGFLVLWCSFLFPLFIRSLEEN